MNRLSAGWFYCCESKNPFLQVRKKKKKYTHTERKLMNQDIFCLTVKYIHPNLFILCYASFPWTLFTFCSLVRRISYHSISLIYFNIYIYIYSVLIPIQILSIYTTYYIACTSDPGIITRKNLKKYLDHHVYDGLIYTPKDCSTCKFQK